MGVDKARLLFNGVPMLSHMSQILHQAGLERVWISGDYPGYQSLADFPLPNHDTEALGPLSGLMSISSHLHHDCEFIIVVPIDMPLLNRSQIKLLLDIPADIPAVAYQQAFFPLRLALDDQLIDQLHSLLSDADPKAHSLRALLERLPTCWLPLPENADCFSNANTPEEWLALQQKSSQKLTEN
jgi:molybdopterin-guanine dinucleotide biosynthesis protein A